MKKIYQILLLICLCVCFTGCGKTENAQREKRTTDNVEDQSTQTPKVDDQNLKPETESTGTGDNSENKSKILIAYFTRADNIRIDPNVDATSSASINRNVSSYKGNLTIMADYIKDATGGDTFSILTTEYYPTKYRDSTNTAKEEQRGNARPELSSHVENMEDYDIIFLGYPNWWGIAAWPVDNFVKGNDFTGKTVIPFCTSASSGIRQSGQLLEEMAGSGDWQDGQRFRSGASASDVQAWLEELGLVK